MGKRFISFWYRLFCGLSGFSLTLLAFLILAGLVGLDIWVVAQIPVEWDSELQAIATMALLFAEVIGLVFYFLADEFKEDSKKEKDYAPIKKTRKKRRTKAEMKLQKPTKKLEPIWTEADMVSEDEMEQIDREQEAKQDDEATEEELEAMRIQQEEDDYYREKYGEKAPIAGPRGTYHLSEIDLSDIAPGELTTFKRHPWNSPDTYTSRLKALTVGMSILINNDIDHVGPNVWLFKKRFPQRDYKCKTMGHKLVKVKRVK